MINLEGLHISAARVLMCTLVVDALHFSCEEGSYPIEGRSLGAYVVQSSDEGVVKVSIEGCREVE